MPKMQTSDLTARQFWERVRANPGRAKFGFGTRAALLNVDLQRAYTDVGRFASAYETDPRQIELIRELSALARARGVPVIWTRIAYSDDDRAGVWGMRSDTPDSLQNIRAGSERADIEPRLGIDRGRDVVITKRMPSAFFDTGLDALLRSHGVDTLIVTGGSTSGCVRASVVDALSRDYRVIVVEECVADRHEIPHFASLADMMLKYADVEPFAVVRDWLMSKATSVASRG